MNKVLTAQRIIAFQSARGFSSVNHEVSSSVKGKFSALEEVLCDFSLSTFSFEIPSKPFCFQKSCLPKRAFIHTAKFVVFRSGTQEVQATHTHTHFFKLECAR